MFTRTLSDSLLRSLQNHAAVALLGPRQVGKTTLAMAIGQALPSVYLDLENLDDVYKLQSPEAYLAQFSDRLVIIDEVQQIPQLFRALRGLIDRYRREGRGTGRFLLLGSASNALLQQSSESLAGRIQYLSLTGLSPLEIGAEAGADLMPRLWSRGGFPQSYLVASDEASFEWRRSFIMTYLQRDLPQLGVRFPAEALWRFWSLLAYRQGEPMNATDMAKRLGVSTPTVTRYLDIMVDLMLVRRLPPYSGNGTKRIVKTPRIYVRDSGLMHALLGIKNWDELMLHPALGKSWEGMVIENIASVLPEGVGCFYYRTGAGAEIDLVLEWAPEETWAIEIKASRQPALSKGFHIACEDIQAQQRFVVYTGEDTIPRPDGVTVLPLNALMQQILARG